MAKQQPKIIGIGTALPDASACATPDAEAKSQPVTILGDSPALRAVLARADRVAPTMTPVLIQGATGTGKELFARRIHEKSGRTGAFVAINCAAFTNDLLVADLFGHERGSFTGASETRLGAFEQANGGTLFLDEIGEMAPEHQAKVLRALQEGEVRRVGATKTLKVDVRIVAATHRDLRASGSSFREDLYFRVARYRLELPTLHDRGADVIDIARKSLKREHPNKHLSREAKRMLLQYQWPGNVRDLESAVESAAIDARARSISAADLRAQLPEEALVPEVPAASRLAAVQAHIALHGHITATDVRVACFVKASHAKRLLQAWVQEGHLEPRGRGRGAYYVAVGATETVARGETAVRLATERGSITRQDLEREARISSRTAKRTLSDLVKSGRLCARGAGKRTTYELARLS